MASEVIDKGNVNQNHNLETQKSYKKQLDFCRRELLRDSVPGFVWTWRIICVLVVLSHVIEDSYCMRPSRSGYFQQKSHPFNQPGHHENSISLKQQNMIPIVINTWAFTEAAQKGWDVLQQGGSVLDAVEQGCTECENLQCDGTVGYGGSPDENGETTLDAMIMDGDSHAVGSVGCLRGVKNAVGVARKIMEHTKHTMLVGELAKEFALKMGFTHENLSTESSLKMNEEWKANNCQPNFWKNVTPDPSTSCGPYSAAKDIQPSNDLRKVDQFDHDTIGMVVIDSRGKIASGTSSNGARNKIPGRVGDAPIVGAGSYVDRNVGGAAATGDGDVMVRFLPSFLAVENMRQGFDPTTAAQLAISRIVEYYPDFSGALIAVNLRGEHGAACHRIPNGFPYSVRDLSENQVKVITIPCL